MPPKPSILLIDDETAIAGNLAPFQRSSGFDVATASIKYISPARC
jgi:DNA-binding response OmpR family regulator